MVGLLCILLISPISHAERKGCRMKIEKINENQIRCTLTRDDLASRQLKISELAYGTEKAKNLFREMMRQANFEFGFEAEDIPLMIEAIPLNAECIVLIITKVEDPEELDTRFARFAPSVTEDSEVYASSDEESFGTEDELFDIFRKLQPAQDEAGVSQEPTKKEASCDEQTPANDRNRLFVFATIQQVMELSSVIADKYQGTSTLYKDIASKNYLLFLSQGQGSRESFDRACNIASEYGARRRSSLGSNAFLSEHCETIIAENVIQSLGGM